MPEKTIELKDFDELLKALNETPKTVMPYITKAMTLSVRSIQARVAEYPQSTAANQPGRIDKNGRPMGYYERGRGWWYPVLQTKTLGEKIGVAHGAETAKRAAKRNKVKTIPTVAGYKLAAGGTSEMLGRSWDARVDTEDNVIVGLVGTNTSYADYVQGGKQSQLHQAIGWKTLDTALEESQEDIKKFFQDATDQWIKREIK